MGEQVLLLLSMSKPPKRLIKFSISIRQETRQLVDVIANDENRSRSSMIDLIIHEYCKKKQKK